MGVLQRFWTKHRLATVLCLALLFLGLLLQPWSLVLVLAVSFGGPLLKRLESFKASPINSWRRNHWIGIALGLSVVLLALTGGNSGRGALILALLPVAWVLVTDRSLLQDNKQIERGSTDGSLAPSTTDAEEEENTEPPEPLVGAELLAKVKELGDVGKSDLVRACGYFSIKDDGNERINFTQFYEALLEAKDIIESPDGISNAESNECDVDESHPTKIEQSDSQIPWEDVNKGFVIFASPIKICEEGLEPEKGSREELAAHAYKFIDLIANCNGCWGSEYITKDSGKSSAPFFVIDPRGDCLFSLLSKTSSSPEEQAKIFLNIDDAVASESLQSTGRIYACIAFTYNQGDTWIEFNDFGKEIDSEGDDFENIPTIAREMDGDVEVYLRIPDSDGETNVVFYGSWDADGDLDEEDELSFSLTDQLKNTVFYGNPFEGFAEDVCSEHESMQDSVDNSLEEGLSDEITIRFAMTKGEGGEIIIDRLFKSIIDSSELNLVFEPDVLSVEDVKIIRVEVHYNGVSKSAHQDCGWWIEDNELVGHPTPIITFTLNKPVDTGEFKRSIWTSSVSFVTTSMWDNEIDPYTAEDHNGYTSVIDSKLELDEYLEEIDDVINNPPVELELPDGYLQPYGEQFAVDTITRPEISKERRPSQYSAEDDNSDDEENLVAGVLSADQLKSKQLSIRRSIGPFAIEITKSMINKPDSDGDVSIDVDLNLSSFSDEDIELVLTKLVVLTANGLPLIEQEDERELLINNASTEEIGLNSGYFKAAQIAGSPASETQVLLQVVPCGCKYTELPLLELTSPGNITGLSEKVELQRDVQLQGFSVVTTKPDEEGNCQLEVKGLIVNESGCLLNKVVMKIRLLDRNGREIDSTEWSEKVPPSGTICVDTSVWGIKPSRLDGARANISTKIFSSLGSQELSWSVGSKPVPIEADMSQVGNVKNNRKEEFNAKLAVADRASELPLKEIQSESCSEFDLEIESAKYRAPDSDGETSYEIEYNINNRSNKAIELLLTRLFILHKSGLIVAASENESEDMAECGESISSSISSWGVSVNELDGVPDDVQLMLQATACSCLFRELGSIYCPRGGKTEALIPITEGETQLSVEVLTIATDPPDDGECGINIKALVKNNTTQSFPRVVLSTRLISTNGRELEDTYTQEEIPPNGQIVLEDSFWGIKENRLNSAKLQFSLKAFAATGSCTFITKELSLED